MIVFLVVKYLRYYRFSHAVPVNRNCVVMSCLEMDVGNFYEIAFNMTVERDFQWQSLQSSLRYTFYSTVDQNIFFSQQDADHVAGDRARTLIARMETRASSLIIFFHIC